MSKTPECVLKFVLVGDSNVGKSQLLLRFCREYYQDDSFATIGMEFSTKDLRFVNCTIKAQIWDTAGQERFESMTRAYYRDAVGAILVYDMTNEQSFHNLPKWLSQLRDFGHPHMLLSLVGNKADVDESELRIATVRAQEFAKTERMDFMEVSAKNGRNVETVFRRLIMSVARRVPEIQALPISKPLPDGYLQLQKGVYQNYWTGEITKSKPTSPAPQGETLSRRFTNRQVIPRREGNQEIISSEAPDWNCAICVIL